MKAKVKASGDIIEVKEWRGPSDVVYSTLDMNMFYAANEVEIITDTPEEVTIEGWVARGANPHHLALYERKPDRLSDIWGFSHSLQLDPTYFPEVTWATEPKRVKLTITPIEE